ncbi:hypothetical protein L6164_002104 [Bauhinia variegata]|uniref:Uncharacterized protein n=1 Tax=Bauhinia variegata TaxID=167791 RepID=A0ACB9PXB2_BAUVA|nr:hypothetical protein L6164_002104 [Bauhinia variegata]
MANQTNKVTLRARDGNIFQIEEDIATEFGTLKALIEEDGFSDSVIPLSNVWSPTLAKVIEYCRKHYEFRSRPDQNSGNRLNDEKAFDDDFISDLDEAKLKEMLLAANYLDVKGLLNLISRTIADRIKNKSVEFIRKFFRVENDYTPQEERDVREKYAWTFQGVDDD